MRRTFIGKSFKPYFCLLPTAFCFLLFVACLPQAHAADFGKGPAQKFARGFAYLIASPLQLPRNVIQASAETDPVYLAPWRGFAVGAGSGLYHMGRQGIAAFWDIFTFWTPAGRDWGPLYEPASLVPEI